MAPKPEHQITRLLQDWKRGDGDAMHALMPLVETELRRLAATYMRRERSGHTLQPTALVNEAWLRVSQREAPNFEGRSHFVAVAAHYMRQILVEHARKRNAGKRGGGAAPLQLNDATVFAPGRSADLLALDDGIRDLAALDARQAQIVELHFFGGLSQDEIAAHLGISRSTVLRDLRMAESWLRNYLTA